MSHYSKQITKIMAEKETEKKKQKELEKENNLQSEYINKLFEVQVKIANMSPEEANEFAQKITNEIRLNNAKLLDNKEILTRTDAEDVESVFHTACLTFLVGAVGIILGAHKVENFAQTYMAIVISYGALSCTTSILSEVLGIKISPISNRMKKMRKKILKN